jgi:hypothetical protein
VTTRTDQLTHRRKASFVIFDVLENALRANFLRNPKGCFLDPGSIEYTVPVPSWHKLLLIVEEFSLPPRDSAFLRALCVSAVLFSFWLRPHGRVRPSRLSQRYLFHSANHEVSRPG